MFQGRFLAEPNALVIELCQKFLNWQKPRGEPATYEFYFKPLESFTIFLGAHKRLRDLKPYHVQEWLDKTYPKSGPTYRHNLIRAVKRPFIWARKLGYIDVDPLASVHRGSPVSRQCYLEPEQWNELMRLVKPGPFRDFLNPVAGDRGSAARSTQGGGRGTLIGRTSAGGSRPRRPRWDWRSGSST